MKTNVFYAIRLTPPDKIEHRGLFGQGQWFCGDIVRCTTFIFQSNDWGTTKFYKTFEEAKQTREKLITGKSYSSIIKITETENMVKTEVVLKGDAENTNHNHNLE